MRYVVLIVAVLSLLVAGCATTEEVVDDDEGLTEEPTGTEETAEETGVDVDAVDEALVEDDLERSMDSIDLDDW